MSLSPEGLNILRKEVFRTGVSSAETVDENAGRGVGMAAVTNLLEPLKGTVTMEFKENIVENMAFAPFSLHISLPL